MEAQVTRLKINATNLKNSLVGYNKNLRKIRLEENRLAFDQEKAQQSRDKEANVERGGIGKTVESIKSRILASPLGFFAKIKEFFGLVLLGLFINNLPRMINGLKQFFGENAWLIDTTKIVIKVLGDGIMGMIWLVDTYPKAKQKELERQLSYVSGELDKASSFAEQAWQAWTSFFNQGSSGSSTPTPPPLMAPGSMYPVSIPSSSGSGASPSSSGPTSSSSRTPQGYKKGGTIDAKEQTSSKDTITAGFRGATASPLGKKAIESVDSFENLSTVASSTKINAQLLADRDGINDTFNKVNESFSQFLTFFRSHEKRNIRPTGDNPPGGNGADPDDPSPSGTPTPGSLSAILPFGAPQFTSGYRTVNRPNHMGLDFGVDAGSPVTASQDGTFDSIIPNFEHGSAVLIKYKDGFYGKYGHVDVEPSVLKMKSGDPIKKGQVIAKVKPWYNAHGYKDNTHLHYERLNPNRRNINPSSYLNSLAPAQPSTISATGKPITVKSNQPNNTYNINGQPIQLAPFDPVGSGLQQLLKGLERSSTSLYGSGEVAIIDRTQLIIQDNYIPMPMIQKQQIEDSSSSIAYSSSSAFKQLT